MASERQVRRRQIPDAIMVPLPSWCQPSRRHSRGIKQAVNAAKLGEGASSPRLSRNRLSSYDLRLKWAAGAMYQASHDVYAQRL